MKHTTTIPLSVYFDSPNDICEIDLLDAGKLYLDNDPDFEKNVKKWMSGARNEGHLDSDFRYLSYQLGERS